MSYDRTIVLQRLQRKTKEQEEYGVSKADQEAYDKAKENTKKCARVEVEEENQKLIEEHDCGHFKDYIDDSKDGSGVIKCKRDPECVLTITCIQETDKLKAEPELDGEDDDEDKCSQDCGQFGYPEIEKPKGDSDDNDTPKCERDPECAQVAICIYTKKHHSK